MTKKPFVTKEKLEEIAAAVPTPFHIYDEKGIRENAKAVKEAFSWNPGFREYFAVKANPNPTLIKMLGEYDCGCDCSSYTELMLSDGCRTLLPLLPSKCGMPRKSARLSYRIWHLPDCP